MGTTRCGRDLTKIWTTSSSVSFIPLPLSIDTKLRHNGHAPRSRIRPDGVGGDRFAAAMGLIS